MLMDIPNPMFDPVFDPIVWNDICCDVYWHWYTYVLIPVKYWSLFVQALMCTGWENHNPSMSSDLTCLTYLDLVQQEILKINYSSFI